MEGLYPLTLIGNPLHIPFLETRKCYDKLLYNPDPGDHYSILPKVTTAGLWIAYEPIRLKNGCGIYMAQPNACLKAGILQGIDDGERFDTCIQRLVDSGVIMNTTYRKAFRRLGIEDYFDERLTMIPEQVYQIHREAFEAVDIVQVRTNRNGTPYRSMWDFLKIPVLAR